MVRLSFAVVVLTFLGCGTEPTPPGILTITPDDVPAIRTTGTLTLTGSVSREPVIEDAVIVVTLLQGTSTTEDTVGTEGRYAFSVTLTPNAVTTLFVSATDATGSTATAVQFLVRHDDQLPTVAALTPSDGADKVSPSTVTITFSEPVRPGNLQVTLQRYGLPLAGTLQVSADSTSATLTPAAPLLSNAIHAVTVSGMLDEAGLQGTDKLACFVTNGAQATFTDPANDLFVDPTPGMELQVLDIRETRFAQNATTLFGVILFSNPRSFDAQSPANLLAVIDLDTDRDSTTGVVSVKDTAFTGTLPRSRLGADFAVWLLPQTTPNDSSVVVQYTAPLTGNVSARLLPRACGNTVGFAAPRAALGNDDGSFDATVYADAYDANGGYLDAAPDSAIYTVSLPMATQPWGALFAPALPEAGSTVRLDRLRRRMVPRQR